MTSDMCIYEKLSHIQVELLNCKIQKSGWNPWGQFSFFELKDILPPVLKLCNKYECTPLFSFDTDYGYLFLKSWGESDSEIIEFTCPLPTLEKLPKMNLVQTNGTYQTYTRRYLLISAFGIVEPELIDSLNIEQMEKLNNKPKALDKVINCILEDNPDAEITNKLINGTSLRMYQNKLLTKSERIEIYNYCNKKGNGK